MEMWIYWDLHLPSDWPVPNRAQRQARHTPSYPKLCLWSPQCSPRPRGDADVFPEALMVSVLCIAIFSEMPEGVHTKHSVNKQQVNKCMGRMSLSNMATHYIHNSYYNRGKLYTCGKDSWVNSHPICLTCYFTMAMRTKCRLSVRILHYIGHSH